MLNSAFLYNSCTNNTPKEQIPPEFPEMRESCMYKKKTPLCFEAPAHGSMMSKAPHEEQPVLRTQERPEEPKKYMLTEILV